MPGKVKIKIVSGRNLPIMDRSSDTTDAYVEIKLGNVTHKTDVCRKSLNPQWNSDFYRFEVDDAELQDEPLQIRLMDHDTYSANDAIGKVYISLNPLLLPNLDSSAQNFHTGKGSVMSGWIPVFDTMHGIRGEVNIILKVDLFSDVNKFRQSSCGVQFFHSPIIPHGFYAQMIHGFVEELVVNDDPEYQWIDKIRTPRASNEARQIVFLKLSGQVQRKIGLKAIDLGANAVIGYTQCFDLEGDVGVVARGIGTAVTLVKIQEIPYQPVLDNALVEERTIKYLEFLTCAGNTSLHRSSPSKFDIDRDTINPLESVHQISRFQSPTACNASSSKKESQTEQVESETNAALKHHEHIKQLLALEDKRCENKRNPFTRKFQNIHCLSKKLLNRQMITLKAKISDKRASKSNVELTRVGNESARSSVSDLDHRDRIRSHNQRSASDGSAMVHLLVRSMITSNTIALDSITEHTDSLKSSPNHSHKDANEFPPISFASPPKLTQLSPNNTVSCDSSEFSSSLTSSGSSSSGDEEDHSEDYSRQTSQSFPDLNMNTETVSMVIKTVLAQETDEKSQSMRTSDQSTTKLTPIIQTGCARQTKLKKKTNLQIIENVVMSDDMERILTPLTAEQQEKWDWIQPGSTADDSEIEPEKHHRHVFQDLRDNIVGKIRHVQDHLRVCHRDKVNNDMVFESATEATLIDSGNIFNAQAGAYGVQSEPKRRRSRIRKFKKRLSLSHVFGTSKSSKYSTESVSNLHCQQSRPKPKSEIKDNDGMLSRAMKTILMDKVNIIEDIVVPPPPIFDKDSLNASSNVLFGDTDLQPGNKSTVAYASLIDLKTNTVSERKSIDKIHGSKSDGDLTMAPQCKLNSGEQQTYSANAIHNSKSFQDRVTITVSYLPSYSQSSLGLENNSNINPTSASHLRLPHTSKTMDFLSTNQPSLLVPDQIPVRRLETTSSSTAINAKPLGHMRAESAGCKMPQSPIKLSGGTPNTQTQHSVPPTVSSIGSYKESSTTGIYRRSSDSDLSVTPKVLGRKRNSLTSADRAPAGGLRVTSNVTTNIKPPINQENLDMLEYPFLTLAKYPPGFIIHLGATVAARSVKLLERVPNPDEPETRDSWWTELRIELRSHARALGCNIVLGYSEMTTISDDVCVLSATGTAAVINLQYATDTLGLHETPITVKSMHVGSAKETMTCSLDRQEFSVSTKDGKPTVYKVNDGNKNIENSETDGTATSTIKDNNIHLSNNSSNMNNGKCSISHLPYNQSSIPFNVHVRKCSVCKRGKVPDVLLATIEIPDGLQITGRGSLVQAQVCRTKRDIRAETNAKEISDGLPFLEYELHRLLINKLKVKGMNAIFGLKATVAIGEKMMALIATGTAVFLTGLPVPQVPKIVAGNSWTDTEKLNEIQKTLNDTVARNREIYQLKSVQDQDTNGSKQLSDTDDSDEELAEMDLNLGNKDTCVLEIDDIEDLEIIGLLMEPCPPEGFHIVNTQSVPGLHDMEVVRNLQMFTQVWRAKFSMNHSSNLSKHFQRLLQSINFKLRSMIPCAICDLNVRLDLPESEEIQLLVTGMALGLGDPSKLSKTKRKGLTPSLSRESNRRLDDEMIFNLDEDQPSDGNVGMTHSVTTTPISNLSSSNLFHHQTGSLRLRTRSPIRSWQVPLTRISRHMPVRERYGVDISPLSYVPGGKIDKYLGNLDFFFIRESTSVRENGGISGFVHSFVTELLAIVRAHVTALGGNAMVSFYMTELILVDNPHKNQGQCLISVGGDVVFVSYFTDD